MPELPEVETIVCQLREALVGRTVNTIVIHEGGREFPAGEEFVRGVVGQQIHDIKRRAKVVLIELSGDTVLVGHLKMTGKLLLSQQEPKKKKHDRILFVFDDGTFLAWSDIRKFGYLKLVEKSIWQEIEKTYGPEPLDHDATELAATLLQSKRTIKAALLDQSVIAGIGNIYADEACHRAGLHPGRPCSTLSAKERLRLMSEVQNVLRASLAQKGTSANDYVDTEGKRGGFLSLLRVYRRTGKPCTTCQTPIEKIVLAGRGTHFCPKCQK